jgi:hypothetical protein
VASFVGESNFLNATAVGIEADIKLAKGFALDIPDPLARTR